MTMINWSENKLKIGLGVVFLLLAIDILNYWISGWGLITVKVKDAPLGQVIHSIERQGWVKIYSNIDPQLKVTMFCDHVSLPDAMETLAANIDEPAPADANGAATAGGNGGANAGGNNVAGGDGGQRRGGRGGGLGGFGGGAQWHLGFFVGPTSSQVNEEIRLFNEGADRSDDSLHTYNFPTMLGMISDDDSSVADPRKQVWPGVKLPDPPPPNPDGTPATNLDGTAIVAEQQPTTVQGYLRCFARQADIWIIAPVQWDPAVSTPPAPNDSIISAIRRFVSSANGSVKQAIILRGREQRAGNYAATRPAGSGNRGGGLDLSLMEDRVNNAINGLPIAEQAPARAKVQAEVKWQKDMSTIPWDQRRDRMRQHMFDLMMAGDKNWRRSPEKRAQMMSKLVNNRIAAIGK